jgi:hypothetical protein
MGVDLSGRHGRLYMNQLSWSSCLGVAFAFGWEPEGTEAPDFGDDCQLTISAEEWDNMDYTSNSAQWVKDTDAQAMWAALLRALDACKTAQPISDTQHALLSETFPDMSETFPDILEERIFPINGRLINEGLRGPLEKLATFTGGGGFYIF